MQIASYHRHVSKQRAVAVAADGGAAPAPPSSQAAAVAVAKEAVAAGGVAATNQHGHNFVRNTPWKRRTAKLELFVLSVSQVRNAPPRSLFETIQN